MGTGLREEKGAPGVHAQPGTVVQHARADSQNWRLFPRLSLSRMLLASIVEGLLCARRCAKG